MNRGITEERLSRLPNWAGDEIRRLNREVRELRQDVEMMSGDIAQGDTNTFADPHRSLRGKDFDLHDCGLPLRRNEQIRFHLSEAKRSDEHIDARVEDGYLWIHGGAGLTMTIQASNTIYLECRR